MSEEQGCRWIFNFTNWRPSDEEWTDWLDRVQAEERARIGRFRKYVDGQWVTGPLNPDAKSSLVGRLMLRRVCAESLCIPEDEVCLTRSPKNKPLIDASETPFPGFNANVSHAGDLVVLGSVCVQGLLIGVDVMPIEIPHGQGKLDAAERFFDDMSSSFSPREWHHIEFDCERQCGGPGECAAARRSLQDRTCQFFRYWVLKESYIKAVGEGLHLELNRMDFEFEFPPSGPDHSRPSSPIRAALRLDGNLMPDWQFALHHVDGTDRDHIIGVALGPCAEKSVSRETLRFCDAVDLPWDTFKL